LLLLRRDDIDANSTDTHGRTSLWWASRKGCKVVQLPLDREDVAADSKGGDGSDLVGVDGLD
jgi:hypothetical protein